MVAVNEQEENWFCDYLYRGEEFEFWIGDQIYQIVYNGKYNGKHDGKPAKLEVYQKVDDETAHKLIGTFKDKEDFVNNFCVDGVPITDLFDKIAYPQYDIQESSASRRKHRRFFVCKFLSCLSRRDRNPKK